MLPEPVTPRPWKRNPIGLWAYIALGAGRIILSGIGLVVPRFRRRK